MNLVELQRKLVAAARANRPSDHVPYAFEKRVTALLASRVPAHRLDAWVHGLWRAAVSCVVIAIVCGALAAYTASPAASSTDLSQDIDNVLLASVDQTDQMQ